MEPLIAHRYQLVRPLGQGAMGRVDLVRDTVSGQDVALKAIQDPTGAKPSAQGVLQFRQEFRLMTRLRHPNCCAVYDFGQLEDGAPYLTMEVVPGQGLDEALPLDEATFRRVFAQVLMALGYVHQQGFVHLDLKPANVRVTPDGVVKLMDFGLMEVAGQTGLPIRGTLPYLAPEVIKRGPLDGRADLYSAGVLAFELLTGKLPFARPTPAEVLRAHLNDRPPAPSSLVPGLPAELDRMVARLLAKEPEARYASAHDVLVALGVEPPPGLGGTLLAAPLVGRDAEIAALEAALAALRRGEAPAAMWLWGPPGVGKSRVLDEARCMAQLDNLPFVRVASHEVGDAPYAGLTALLRGLLPDLRAAVPEALERHSPVLVALLPELGGEAAPEMDSPRSAMLRLFAEATAVLAACAAVRPLVWLVEDWRNVDEATREFLRHFRRNAPDAPVFLVATTRRGPDTSGGPEDVVPYALAGLDEAAVGRMVAGMLGLPAPPPSLAAQIFALTGGMPRDVEQVLDHVVRGGVLARAGAGWAADVAPGAVGLPGGLASAWQRRLGMLGPDGATVALALAVAGRPVELAVLGAIAGVPEEAVFATLVALVRDRAVQRDAAGAYGLMGADDVQVLLDLSGRDDRRPIHRRLVEALRSTLAGRPLAEAPLELVAELAIHGDAAEAGTDALPWCLEAARRAVGLFALADADRHLAAAARLTERLGEPLPPAYRLELARLKADVARYRAQLEAAVPLYAAAIAEAEALAAWPVLVRVLTAAARVAQMQGNYPEALALAGRAAEVGEAHDDHAGASGACEAMARTRLYGGDTPGMLRDAERALALAERSGDPFQLGQALAAIGIGLVLGAPERTVEGLNRLREARAIQRRIGHLAGLINVNDLIGNAALSLGDYALAEEAFEDARASAQALDRGVDELGASCNLAEVALARGDVARAHAMALQVRARAEATDEPVTRCVSLLIRGQAALALGALDEGAASAERALEEARGGVAKYLEALVLPRLGEVRLALGDLAGAERMHADLRQVIAETGNLEQAAACDLLGAELARRRGEPEVASAALRKLQAEADRIGSKGLRLAALIREAHLGAHGKEWERVARIAGAALGLAREAGARQLEAESRLLLGLAELRCGQDDASAHFEAAEAWAEAASVPWTLARALFGRAASAPMSELAAGRARRARELVDEVAARTPTGEAMIAADTLADGIRGGDYKAFGAQAGPAKVRPAGPVGMPFGGMGLG